MPTCRNCHREISNYDKDICPYCGTEHPIDEGYKTKDITQFVDPVTGDYKLYKSKSKKAFVLLTVFLGVFGVGYFYIGKKKAAIISLVSTVAWTAALGSLLFFLAEPLHNALGYLIPFFVAYIFFVVYGLVISRSDSLRDGNGEFLR
jgi:hypothetical protein